MFFFDAILQRAHALADLLDVLSDAELCADDFDRLVPMLPLPVFVLLLSQYTDDAFLTRESEQLKYLPKLPKEVFERSDSSYGVGRYLVKPEYLPQT